jgi:hypothetical protein
VNAKKYYASIKQDRDEWSSQFTSCMWCGSDGGFIGLETHEVQRKSSSQGRWATRCNYLRLCQQCHAGPFANMPHVEQMKLKAMADFENYDLQAWLRIADPELRAPDRITQEEVDAVVLNFPVSGNGLRF